MDLNNGNATIENNTIAKPYSADHDLKLIILKDEFD